MTRWERGALRSIRDEQRVRAVREGGAGVQGAYSGRLCGLGGLSAGIPSPALVWGGAVPPCRWPAGEGGGGWQRRDGWGRLKSTMWDT